MVGPTRCCTTVVASASDILGLLV
ncbi:hypothetical protein HU200_058379 [Digitaria exilis]|uniref:Uncharacterized protein n=1 Tax=Digitaria exilis TaxID=1010633 RepID=A0A835AE12_9POAL|nr:hypothetical protein HU200_058379 [Digitaria exilis]